MLLSWLSKQNRTTFTPGALHFTYIYGYVIRDQWYMSVTKKADNRIVSYEMLEPTA